VPSAQTYSRSFGRWTLNVAAPVSYASEEKARVAAHCTDKRRMDMMIHLVPFSVFSFRQSVVLFASSVSTQNSPAQMPGRLNIFRRQPSATTSQDLLEVMCHKVRSPKAFVCR
jgi:hypothetical protein